MSGIQQELLGGPFGGQYQIQRSLRFNSADSAYLSRTPVSTGNRKKFTYSCWVKRSAIGTSGDQILLRAADGVENFNFVFSPNDTFFSESGANNLFTSTPVYRDLSAWYHVVMVFDSDNATAANRFIVYVNNVSQAKASGSVDSGKQLAVNTQNPHYIGASPSDRFLSGYMTEIYFVDGQALTPSSFGETNADTGVWQPKAYTGTYGTNGFYLNFSDNSGTTSTTLGKDYSGNGNNWTPNNFSVTAGAGNDSLVDTPTPYGTDTGAGGEVRGNYATLNPLSTDSDVTLSNGNLDYSVSSGNGTVRSTIALPSSGKWVWEFTKDTAAGMVGVVTANAGITGYVGTDAYGWGYFSQDGKIYNNGIGTGSNASWTTTGDVITCTFDADTGVLTFYKNNSVQPTTVTGLTSGPYFIAVGSQSGNGIVNFGQRPFAYTAPSGFKALVTQNLPTPTIGATSTTQADNYFNVVARTFTAATAVITGLGFSPDWLWFKRRNVAASHSLYDRLRGTNARLLTNGTNAEITTTSAELTSFDSDGFTIGADPGSISINAANGDTGVVWCWRANGAGSSNTAGTITSTVSANTTAGFSIVTYTGNATTDATIGHGLGVTPQFFVVKNRSTTSEWLAYHVSTGKNGYMQMQSTAAFTSSSNYWGSTGPTSTTIQINGGGGVNNNGSNYVVYCFAAVAGYSAFGSYVGNNSADGPFIYTGFRPRYVLVKSSSAAVSDWVIYDTSRPTYNQSRQPLYANLSNAEPTAGLAIDLVSNGFKWREGGGEGNDTSVTYIYAAFAEFPFKYTLAR